MSVNAKKLGKAIYEYFLQRTSPNENFKLCIDTYTYEHCAHQAGLNDKEIESLLSGEGINYIDDNYCALAIAALETKIAYDVETESNLVNSYNSRLIDKLRNFKDNNDVQQFYKDSQDVIWLKSKNFSKQKKDILKSQFRKQDLDVMFNILYHKELLMEHLLSTMQISLLLYIWNLPQE